MSNEHPDDTYGFSHRYECIKEGIKKGTEPYPSVFN